MTPCAQYEKVLELKHAFILKWGVRQLEADYRKAEENSRERAEGFKALCGQTPEAPKGLSLG